MKILILSSTNDVKNGYGNITHELTSYLHGKVDFDLLLPGKGLPPYIFNLKTPKALGYLTFDWPAQEYDLIHSLFEFPYALIGARLARRYKKPLIIGTQGTYAIQPLFWWPERPLLRWAYNSAKIITAPSVFTQKAIQKYAHPKPEVRVIHNGVNFERFQTPADVLSIKNQWPGKKLLLTVGGLKPRKGHDVIIRALGALSKKRDDFHYLVVGGGKLRDSLEQLTHHEGVADRVGFIGEVIGEHLVAYFQACDLYVHTPILANWQFEGFGIVYLEASACRKPIVAADSGGVRDAVIDGTTGIVVPESDVAATARAIETILDDPGLAQRLGDQGYEYAQQHDWGAVGKQFLDLYEEVIKT